MIVVARDGAQSSLAELNKAGVPGSRAVLAQKRADSDKAVAKLVGRSDEIQRAPGRPATRRSPPPMRWSTR